MDTASLVFKVLSGKASESENSQLDQWIKASEANKAEFNDLRLLWCTLETRVPDKVEHFYEGLLNIKNRIQEKNNHKKRRASQLWSGFLVIGLVANVSLFLIHAGPRTGPMEFTDAPLQEVINTIEDEFEINIETEQSAILSCRFTGTFYNVDKENDVLRILVSALNLKYKLLHDRNYLLSGSGC